MEISVLVGKTLTDVVGLYKNSEEVIFTCSDGSRYKMHHYQDCCESVWLADLDLTGELSGEVYSAEETGREATTGAGGEVYESGTWTFYLIRTASGSVWLRWLGESNGYYSESVSFEEIT